ncbi:hypothetical protein CSUI_009495 [Cystoisospora suis]|uniref:Uncharacterized protein n=1 Tax=Cystoisospora suis TaxID=483139 RepID=A0A2C6KGL8_9APIC|nr:hypothetical protein CSUI_009495 [Cystoisospora suis]
MERDKKEGGDKKDRNKERDKREGDMKEGVLDMSVVSLVLSRSQGKVSFCDCLYVHVEKKAEEELPLSFSCEMSKCKSSSSLPSSFIFPLFDFFYVDMTN